MRWIVLSTVAALAWDGLAFARQPVLRTAKSSRGHIVVTFSPGELTPGTIAVATSPARSVNGGFIRGNVKLLERTTTTADLGTGVVRFRTHGTVAPGRYYVAVSGILQEPPASCGRVTSHCAERWSNALPVVVSPVSRAV
ncbi:MAG TPA: hypothetical protein VF963_08585 [Gaiellaceae bacterium]